MFISGGKGRRILGNELFEDFRFALDNGTYIGISTRSRGGGIKLAVFYGFFLWRVT